jgi:signal transduction histidine kinase
VAKISKLALDIFNESYIRYSSSADQLRARFDRTQLIRVLTNLVKNSIQAIEQANVANPLIQVRVFADNGQAVIEVEDNGVGIPPENQHRVFEPKFTTKSSGMGLGLAMVKKIVETYGGHISFTSQVGKKTVFRVSFPRI